MTTHGTRRNAYQCGLRQLRDAAISNANLDARVLLAAALEITTGDLLMSFDDPLDVRANNRYNDFLNRRCQNEPVSRLLGRREFWGLDFDLSTETLDPRGDSETLIEAVCDYFPDKNATLCALDLGTGTGCLLIAFLTEYLKSRGVGVDISEGALLTAGLNAGRLGVMDRCHFIKGSWDGAKGHQFDVILSNPPYIPKTCEQTLSREVRLFDPAAALYGGDDGLDAYRALAPILPSILAPGGCVFLEIGQGQDNDVTRLMAASNLSCLEWRRDIQGINRCGVFAHDRP